MANVVSPFPLLNLPNKAIMKVLHSMRAIQQIAISLLSERAKILVKPLDKQNIRGEIRIGDFFRLDIYTGQQHLLNFVIYSERNANVPESVRAYVWAYGENKVCKWRRPGYEVKDWFNHLHAVLNHTIFNNVTLLGASERFGIKSIQKIFSHFSHLKIENCSYMFLKSIIKTFLPKRLTIIGNPFSTFESTHKVVTQNFDFFSWLDSFQEDHPLTLNDLLVMNSLSVDISKPGLSDKDLNRFVKHWINGSNQKMEMIRMWFDRTLNKDILLNGLAFELIPGKQKRTLKKPWTLINDAMPENGPFQTIEISGGFDIQRKDGTKATILLIKGQYGSAFKMYTWH